MRSHEGNAAIAREATVRAATSSSGPPPAPRPRILIVDDEKQVLEGLALHLRRTYDVVARTSGAAALEALDSGGSFTGVISDLRMPRMSGVELLAEVRKRAPEMTRVLLTGYADVPSAVAAVNQAGVHRFLTKPCPPAELARALEEALACASAEGSVKVDEQMARLGRQATLGTMAGSIGHEMGNLVASLAGSLDLVRSQVDRGEVPAMEDICLLGLVNNRLHAHTRALRDLARPRERHIEHLDVATLLCASVDMLKRAGVLKLAKVHIDLPHAPLYIYADRALLEGVLINLLKNAADALAEKAEAATRSGHYADDDDLPLIAIRAEPRGDAAVAIMVEDNGPGIAPENLKRLFNAYFTTKSGAGGTGLGLPIVRETVQQHGGRIDVVSAWGEGTRFTVQLPLAGCPPLPANDPPDPTADSSIRRIPLRLV